MREQSKGTAASLLEAEALRWTYVLRSRERWLNDRSSQAKHEEDARRTLSRFDLADVALQEIAAAESVVVRMPFHTESVGWQGRIFPWEYVIAAATRRYRASPGGARYRHLTVMRELIGPITRTVVARQPTRFVFVQSAPGALQDEWDFGSERERLRKVIGSTMEFVVLENPTPDALRVELAKAELDIVHFSGFGNAEGIRQLSGLPAGKGVAVQYGSDRKLRAEDVLTANRIHDGYMLSAPGSGLPMLMPYETLAEILDGRSLQRSRNPTRPRIFFVSLNLENSAARTAPLMVGRGGALAALGFQDVVNDEFSEAFFELLYSRLAREAWNLPLAFQQAWTLMRSDPLNNAATGSGIALWAGTHLLPQTGQPMRETEPQSRQRIETAQRVLEAARNDMLPERFEVRIKPLTELNYSVLHNGGRLFERFEIARAKSTAPSSIVSVDVSLHLGRETASFARQFTADAVSWSLAEEIHMPLTAGIVRSAREAVNSSLVVQVRLDNAVVYHDSHRLRLLPVDQWRDNASDGPWLPSFIQPRDDAVVKAVEEAQRYVRVLRDDPSAGFEGYQAALEPLEDQMREVDLQVQAVWATLLHDWRLGYINPPPTYSGQLDSQRLRTPTNIRESRSGTCIDLALLLASCLELVDIYPVVFLLQGHALPGYWRHDSFQDKFSSVSVDDPHKVINANENTTSASGAQRLPWRIGVGGYKEILQHIRRRELVPIETVRLTENCGFAEAIEAGIEALSVQADFDSMLDIVIARSRNVTPLPITRERP